MNIKIDLDSQELILEAETKFEKNILKYFNKDTLKRIKWQGDNSGDSLRMSFADK